MSDIIANSVKKVIIPSEKGKNGIGAGIWNIGAGRDPFGGPTRTEIPILDRLPLLAKAGITYLEVHDAEIPAWTKALKVDRKKKYGIPCNATVHRAHRLSRRMSLLKLCPASIPIL